MPNVRSTFSPPNEDDLLTGIDLSLVDPVSLSPVEPAHKPIPKSIDLMSTSPPAQNDLSPDGFYDNVSLNDAVNSPRYRVLPAYEQQNFVNSDRNKLNNQALYPAKSEQIVYNNKSNTASPSLPLKSYSTRTLDNPYRGTTRYGSTNAVCTCNRNTNSSRRQSDNTDLESDQTSSSTAKNKPRASPMENFLSMSEVYGITSIVREAENSNYNLEAYFGLRKNTT